MAEVVLQFVKDKGTAFHNLCIFIKKRARQIKRLSAANIKTGLGEGGGNISRDRDHLFINVFHPPSLEIRCPLTRLKNATKKTLLTPFIVIKNPLLSVTVDQITSSTFSPVPEPAFPSPHALPGLAYPQPNVFLRQVAAAGNDIPHKKKPSNKPLQ
jgi:hypothetical protein